MDDHVDLIDDALDTLVRLLGLQLQLKDESVYLVHHQAELDLQKQPTAVCFSWSIIAALQRTC